MPLGPGYTIEKQTVNVHFVPTPEPRIEISSDYQLRNTGNQPLSTFEVRLPRESYIRLAPVEIAWDGQPISFVRRTNRTGDILRLNLGAAWPMKQTHSLRLVYGFLQGGPQTEQLDFPADSFYLPPDGWLAAPLPPQSTFAGKVAPPQKWALSLRIPGEFVVHATGDLKRHELKNAEQYLQYQQEPPSLSSFVVAGRYVQQEYGGSPYSVILWKKDAEDPAEANLLVNEVQEIAKTFDTLFGSRGEQARQVWIADNPIPSKAFYRFGPEGVADGYTSAQPPPDFGFIDLAESGRPIWNPESSRRNIAESLAKAWLGFGLNPGFDEQAYPLRALPSYAVSIAEEVHKGPQAREKMIADSILEYDNARAYVLRQSKRQEAQGTGISSSDMEFPGKSLLFYYGLEDKFGRNHLHAALKHMVQARKGRGYDLNDLIASLEQETHQNVAEYVRLWLKHPGIPDEFRARYVNSPATASTSSEETTP